MDKMDDIGYYFFIIMAIFMTVTSGLAFLMIEENESESEFQTPWDIIKIFPGFVKNQNLRHFIVFGFLSRFFLAYWGTIG